MNLIYLFCEDEAVKIPFLGFNNEIFKHLIQFGGVWDALHRVFIFKRQLFLKQLKAFFDIKRKKSPGKITRTEEINPEDVTEFLALMEKERNYSASSLNLAITTLF